MHVYDVSIEKKWSELTYFPFSMLSQQAFVLNSLLFVRITFNKIEPKNSTYSHVSHNIHSLKSVKGVFYGCQKHRQHLFNVRVYRLQTIVYFVFVRWWYVLNVRTENVCGMCGIGGCDIINNYWNGYLLILISYLLTLSTCYRGNSEEKTKHKPTLISHIYQLRY